MTRMLMAAVLASAMWKPAPAQADVTIKSTATTKRMGLSGTMTTYIKSLKMRVDTVAGKKDLSSIFDVDNQKMYILKADKKEAEVWTWKPSRRNCRAPCRQRAFGPG